MFQADGWGELQDGYDTIEWIAQQDWSDTRVGTWGHSAMGITGSMAAAALPPHLVCQVVGFAPTNGWGQTAYQGGALRKELLEGWLIKRESAHMLPVFREHPTNDAFWDQYDIQSRTPLVSVPALFIGGFYDCFEKGTIEGFLGRQFSGATGALGNNKLLMGPWTHTNENEEKQGELTFPTDFDILDELEITIKWFDYWLKREDNGIMDEPAVRYFVMGDTSAPGAPGNEWKTGETFPPAHVPTPVYLHPENRLSLEPPTEANQFSTLNFIREDYVPTLGGFNLEIPAGPYDQSPLLSRQDVLVFTSEPLSEPLEIVGEISAVIFAESDLSDTDITVRVADVYPDGRSMLLCDGIQRASFIASDVNPEPIQPGEVVQFTVDCWYTSIVLHQGHRIQIIVANTNYPRFEVNPLYPLLGTEGYPESTETLIHHSEEYPSHVVLPVIMDETGIMDWDVYD